VWSAGAVKGTNPERAAARRLARRRELQELACAEDELSLLEACTLGHCICIVIKSVQMVIRRVLLRASVTVCCQRCSPSRCCFVVSVRQHALQGPPRDGRQARRRSRRRRRNTPSRTTASGPTPACPSSPSTCAASARAATLTRRCWLARSRRPYPRAHADPERSGRSYPLLQTTPVCERGACRAPSASGLVTRGARLRQGTYIEFKDADVPDAWLDSLPKGELCTCEHLRTTVVRCDGKHARIHAFGCLFQALRVPPRSRALHVLLPSACSACVALSGMQALCAGARAHRPAAREAAEELGGGGGGGGDDDEEDERGGGGDGGKDAAEAAPALSEAERRERRAQLAALLRPGEGALDALRRLGGLQARRGGRGGRSPRSGAGTRGPRLVCGRRIRLGTLRCLRGQSPQSWRIQNSVAPEDLDAACIALCRCGCVAACLAHAQPSGAPGPGLLTFARSAQLTKTHAEAGWCVLLQRPSSGAAWRRMRARGAAGPAAMQTPPQRPRSGRTVPSENLCARHTVRAESVLSAVRSARSTLGAAG